MTDDRFRALVENAPDAIVVSREGIVLYANQAAARLLGHEDVSTIVGQPMSFLDRRSMEVMRRRIQQMAATGEALVPREYAARRRDGTEIMAEIASAIIEFDGQQAVIAYARDVTERSRLRGQLAHSDRLASLGMMAAGVAHELNNPLAFVTLAADMLAKRVKPEDAGFVAEVRAGIDRIAGIVRDLRFFGRGDDEPLGTIDVVAAIRSAERLVAHEFRPRSRLSMETGELPAVTGVARHLEQVFVNLFLNAAHAMADEKEGLVAVRARVTPDQVVVTVEDNGKGIPAESLAAIFDPFFTSRPHGEGMGLGLSISRDLVERAGGSLTARSTVGQGTTMELTLARARDVTPTVPAAPPVPMDIRPDGERPRVFVIDDEPLIVQSLARSLGDEVTVVGETDPVRALDRLLSDEQFDAIVCDVMMPGLTGIDLHERVARHRPERASQFVFITGGTYTAHAREYLGRVSNTRLSKPFDTPDLLAAIRRLVKS